MSSSPTDESNQVAAEQAASRSRRSPRDMLLGGVATIAVVSIGIVIGAAISGRGASTPSATPIVAASSTTTPAVTTTVTVPPATTSTTASPPPPTTQPPPPADPQVELDQLASFTSAMDYSRIADTPCGKFAVVSAPDRTMFLEWKNGKWADKSAALQASSDMPVSDQVTTRDYTSDGIYDFLVYFPASTNGGYMHGVGGIFSLNGSSTCHWSWVPIVDEGSPGRFLDGLYWDDKDGRLYGVGYLDGCCGRQDVRVRYDSGAMDFFTTALDAYLGDGG